MPSATFDNTHHHHMSSKIYHYSHNQASHFWNIVAVAVETCPGVSLNFVRCCQYCCCYCCCVGLASIFRSNGSRCAPSRPTCRCQHHHPFRPRCPPPLLWSIVYWRTKNCDGRELIGCLQIKTEQIVLVLVYVTCYNGRTSSAWLGFVEKIIMTIKAFKRTTPYFSYIPNISITGSKTVSQWI